MPHVWCGQQPAQTVRELQGSNLFSLSPVPDSLIHALLLRLVPPAKTFVVLVLVCVWIFSLVLVLVLVGVVVVVVLVNEVAELLLVVVVVVVVLVVV